jgi:predicted  nucleic acid-binding Zn-ribbon protein
MSRAASLLQLQGIDLEIDAKQSRLRAIDAALGDDPMVKKAQRDLLEAEAQVRSARVATQSLEHENQDLAQRIAEVDGRMYGGRVTNPKELQDLQNDVASLQRRRAALEEKQFEALLNAEAADVLQKDVQQRLERAESAAAEAHGTLREEREQLKIGLARLQVNRDMAAVSISAADLELYTRLRQTKKGRAVSELDEGACTACGVAPSSSRIQDARQGNDLILCGNCGRILCAY